MTYAIVRQTPIKITRRKPNNELTDQQVIDMWLHKKKPHSRRAYIADVERLFEETGKTLAKTTLADLQDFDNSLNHLSPNTRKRIISSIKSLFTFGQKIGHLRFNVGKALDTPKPKNTLAERILSEEQVMAMIHSTKNQRDNLLLRLLYASAGRVSEICDLCWKDTKTNGDSGQVTLFGKNDNTRAVKISKATWQALQAYRNDAPDSAPVFTSQKGGHLDPSQVRRIVVAAAKRAGIEGNVSPHWLRHSHASHALDRGANVVLVRDTLGHSSLAITSRYTHAKPNESSALHLAV